MSSVAICGCNIPAPVATNIGVESEIARHIIAIVSKLTQNQGKIAVHQILREVTASLNESFPEYKIAVKLGNAILLEEFAVGENGAKMRALELIRERLQAPNLGESSVLDSSAPIYTLRAGTYAITVSK